MTVRAVSGDQAIQSPCCTGNKIYSVRSPWDEEKADRSGMSWIDDVPLRWSSSVPTASEPEIIGKEREAAGVGSCPTSGAPSS